MSGLLSRPIGFVKTYVCLSKVRTDGIMFVFSGVQNPPEKLDVGFALPIDCIYTLNTLSSRQIDYVFLGCQKVPEDVSCLFFWPPKFNMDPHYVGFAFLTDWIYTSIFHLPAKSTLYFPRLSKNLQRPQCLFFCFLSPLSLWNKFKKPRCMLHVCCSACSCSALHI
jgi:hypothetical protein